MASQSENAAETKDAFLLAEPFLRDVYGAKERAKARKGKGGGRNRDKERRRGGVLVVSI
jgi:hypothetical protein